MKSLQFAILVSFLIQIWISRAGRSSQSRKRPAEAGPLREAESQGWRLQGPSWVYGDNGMAQGDNWVSAGKAAQEGTGNMGEPWRGQRETEYL